MGVRHGVRRVPLREAAELLGVSKDALRQRIRRGTIRSDKGEDGRVYVYVDPFSDGVHGGGGARDDHGSDERYVTSLENQVEYLRRQLDEEREANRENRRIIAGLTQRIPELEPARDPAPPQEPAEASETDVDEQQGRGPAPDTEAPQEPAQPRSWWQRMFGG